MRLTILQQETTLMQATKQEVKQSLTQSSQWLIDLWTKLPAHLQSPDPNIYRSNNYVYVDFETTNIDKGNPDASANRILLAVWVTGSSHISSGNTGKPKLHYQWGNEYELGNLIRDIERADYFIAHNTKFEYGWLRRAGLDINDKLAYCTQIGEYCIAGNRMMRFSLDDSLARYKLAGKESLVSRMMKNGVCPSEIPTKWLERYGKKDVVQGHKLFLKQRRVIFKEGLHKTFFTHNIFTVPLVDIQSKGMHLDKERVNTIYTKFASELNDMQRELDEITGGINTRSRPQMAEFLYKTMGFAVPKDHRGKELVNKPTEAWPDGQPKTDSTTLGKLRGRNKQQRRFLELVKAINKLKDSMSKSLDKFQQCCEETDDHILFANLNQTRTQTHRLSSTGLHYKAQFQNFDRRFKPLFSPRYEGWSIGEADEGQLEYRVAVFLGDDVQGRADIDAGVDAHALTASIIFREDWNSVNGDKSTAVGKRVRTDSKPHTFKPLYGGHSGTEREREYYQAFRDKHTGITGAQEEWISEVYRTRQLQMPTGLKFYWDNAKVNARTGKLTRPDGRPVDQSVCNYPVQYLATAEIVPISVVYIYHLMRAAEMESFLINTVHDSVIAEISPNEGELFDKIAVKGMEDIIYWYLKEVYDINFDVPLEAEVDIKGHWADNNDWKKEYLNAV